MNKTTKKTSFWTEARVERLQKLYNQYGLRDSWAKMIAKQFRDAITPNAVYKKAARMGF